MAKNSTSGWRISLDDNLKLVSCKTCRKKVLESALLNHSQGCSEKLIMEKATPAPVKVKEAETRIPNPPAAAPAIKEAALAPPVENSATAYAVPASKKAQGAKKRKLADPSRLRLHHDSTLIAVFYNNAR